MYVEYPLNVNKISTKSQHSIYTKLDKGLQRQTQFDLNILNLHLLTIKFIFRLASHGVVIIQPWALLSNPTENYHAEWLLNVIKWVKAHMQKYLHTAGLNLGLELDFDNVLIMGHSSGAHVVVEFLKHYCENIRGQIWTTTGMRGETKP